MAFIIQTPYLLLILVVLVGMALAGIIVFIMAARHALRQKSNEETVNDSPEKDLQ